MFEFFDEAVLNLATDASDSYLDHLTDSITAAMKA
jgi:hypothetical protein